MKRKVRTIALLSLAVVVIFSLVAIMPPAPPSKSLCFIVTRISYSNGFPNACSLLLSNMSVCPVQFYGGYKAPWFDIAYRSNGDWQVEHVRTFDQGYVVLAPHEVKSYAIEIPEAAGAFKLGLSFISLTTRGRIAWFIGTHSGCQVLKPVARFLSAQDQKQRSITEWSDVYELSVTNSKVEFRRSDAK